MQRQERWSASRSRNVSPQFGYWLGTCAKRGFLHAAVDVAERPW
jgi:hypothetical protein